MRFWDASAVVSLLIREPSSWKAWDLFRQDPDMALWWATPIECVSALVRVEREGSLASPALQNAWSILGSFRASALEIQPVEEIRLSAERLLAKHPLRAADAQQLAAGIFWRESYPTGASFVTLDGRLRLAAALEGFRALPYSEEVHESGVLEDGAVFELRDSAGPYSDRLPL